MGKQVHVELRPLPQASARGGAHADGQRQRQRPLAANGCPSARNDHGDASGRACRLNRDTHWWRSCRRGTAGVLVLRKQAVDEGPRPRRRREGIWIGTQLAVDPALHCVHRSCQRFACRRCLRSPTFGRRWTGRLARQLSPSALGSVVVPPARVQLLAAPKQNGAPQASAWSALVLNGVAVPYEEVAGVRMDESVLEFIVEHNTTHTHLRMFTRSEFNLWREALNPEITNPTLHVHTESKPSAVHAVQKWLAKEEVHL